jgi:hypothetical protein
MKYAFAGTRSRFTEPTAARAHGRIRTPRRPTVFGASAKRSKRTKLLTPRRRAAASAGTDDWQTSEALGLPFE